MNSDFVQKSIGISEYEYTIFTDLELAALSVVLHCRRCVDMDAAVAFLLFIRSSQQMWP